MMLWKSIVLVKGTDKLINITENFNKFMNII